MHLFTYIAFKALQLEKSFLACVWLLIEELLDIFSVDVLNWCAFYATTILSYSKNK